MPRIEPALPGRTVARRTQGTVAQMRGTAIENQVCLALQRRGWAVLQRRAATCCGEIDIVAEHPPSNLIAFIEVKSRATLSDAACALSRCQRARLIAAAGILLSQHPEWGDRGIRFDLVAVDGAGRMRRITDAFRIGDR
ncbi:YraN family protein [Lichenicoccus roseus]|uniref:UPF0102 protein FE263_03510 n=1 Tax=Lichenicoccus roseus TaxID=2683649 RepID=A0A5R9JBZ3_9PROT|nr:YraN family protein [Lichenicoccus roseus]TLU74273.1 YraN family protein [Lichenicoccus roseus]